jgi:hypothetical protein
MISLGPVYVDASERPNLRELDLERIVRQKSERVAENLPANGWRRVWLDGRVWRTRCRSAGPNWPKQKRRSRACRWQPCAWHRLNATVMEAAAQGGQHCCDRAG